MLGQVTESPDEHPAHIGSTEAFQTLVEGHALKCTLVSSDIKA